MLAAYETFSLASRSPLNWLPTIDGPARVFDGPAPYWLARLFTLAGQAPTDAVKWVLGLSLVGLAVGSYLLVRRLTGSDWAGITAAAAAVSVPYIQASLYLRGDFPEVVALGLAAIALWSTIAATGDDGEARAMIVVASGLAWGFLSLSHVGIAIVTMIAALLFRPKRAGWAGPAAGLLIALTGWFIIGSRQAISFVAPAIAPVDIAQLFSPVWQMALTPREGMTVSAGIIGAMTVVLAFTPLGVVRPWKQALLPVVLLVLSLAWFSGVWSAIPALFRQPYQLIGVASLLLAIIFGVLVGRLGLNRPLTAIAIATLTVAVTYVNLRPQPVVAREPTGLSPSRFVGNMLLLEAPVQVSGNTVTVDLIWQARQPIGQNLTVFVHLNDAVGAVIAQHDGIAVEGKRPTSGWLVGETLTDRHVIRDIPPGTYRVTAGLYVPATGDRIPVIDAEDHKYLGDVTIR